MTDSAARDMQTYNRELENRFRQVSWYIGHIANLYQQCFYPIGAYRAPIEEMEHGIRDLREYLQEMERAGQLGGTDGISADKIIRVLLLAIDTTYPWKV